MSDTGQLKDRLAAPDWDMWLTLASSALERLADAKDARRARAKEVAAHAAPPPPPPKPERVQEKGGGWLRSLLPEVKVEVARVPGHETAGLRERLRRLVPEVSVELHPGREAEKVVAVVPDPAPAPTRVPGLRLPVPRVFRAAPRLPYAVTHRAGRRLNRAAGVLAASVLADSAVEHYRGQFHNKAMYTPLAVSTLSLLVSAHGMADRRPAAHAVRDVSYVVAALTGLLGTGFHVYNVGKRVGGFSWQNLFYKAPLGAPAALTLSGLVGFLAERVRNNRPGTVPRIFGLPAGRVVGLATAGGLMGTVGEAGLLHFRGAFQDPFMYVPVTVPPVAAAAIGRAAVLPGQVKRGPTRWWLRAAAAAGLAGSAFHVYGIGRAMGGWRNWRQNLVDGPPIPAPPAFTGLALAGLAALDLLEDEND